jgi:hypothetical protein
MRESSGPKHVSLQLHNVVSAEYLRNSHGPCCAHAEVWPIEARVSMQTVGQRSARARGRPEKQCVADCIILILSMASLRLSVCFFILQVFFIFFNLCSHV